MTISQWLVLAGTLSFIAAALHIAIIFGGPDWYRFFGAGEGMAQLAESGSHRPTVITAIISIILSIWGLYALSGAGVIPALPLLKLALPLITLIYMVRGLAGLILPFFSHHPAIAQNSVTFWIVSSLICCLFGTTHLVGLMRHWPNLGLPAGTY